MTLKKPMKRNTLSLLLLLCTYFSINSQNLNILTIPPELKEDANAVVRLDNTFIDVKSQDEMIINVEVAVTVLNKLGDDLADINIYYDKTRTIKQVSAKVYNALGVEIKKIKRKDFKDYTASGSNLFTDSRVIYYDYTPISYPYTMHYQYQVKSSNTAFIPRWVYLGSYFKSIENSTYMIKYPEGMTLRKSENNFEGYTVEKEETANGISYKTKNIHAMRGEPYAPFMLDYVPHVKFGVNKFNLEGVDGSAENWEEFGKWYYENLITPTLDLPESAKMKIKSLTKHTQDPIEKAKIVYKYVQDKVRYISIQVGIGGFKPMQASAVESLSYGDCKALTNYTSALLKEVGIDSYHTFLYAKTRRDVDATVAAPEGNHMILYVPFENEDVWLECTSQEAPFGELGDFTDNRDVVVITPEGGKVMRTRIYKEEENFQKIKGDYKLDNDGNFIASVYMESGGVQFDNHLAYEESSEREKEELYKEFWDNINNMTIESAKIENNKSGYKFEETVKFSATNYGVKTGERMIFPINAFNVIGSAPKRVRNRKLPVEEENGFYDVDEVTVELPVDYKVEAISDNVNIETKYGTYKLSITQVDERNITYKRELLFKSGYYPKEEYKAFRDFWKKVVRGDKSKIVLIKK